MDYLTAIKKLYEKLDDEDRKEFHRFLQAKFEKKESKLKEIREELRNKLIDAEFLSNEYIKRIF